MIEKRSILSPIQKFINAESFSGILLFIVTILALMLANSSLQEWFASIWQFEIGIKSEHFKLIKPLILWINDGLMAVFFFLIGLEIKREVLIGELNSLKKAALPAFAAIGGMLVPLGLYLLLNNDPATSKGWGISMATDIAFSLAILKLLGKRVPIGLKVFLIAFAIIDDLGAVLVIAIFYSGQINWSLLLIAGLLLALLYFFSARRFYNKYLFFIAGIIVWYLFLKSGIHPTIAGILLALSIPVRQKISEFTYAEKLNEIVGKITSEKATNDLPLLTHKQIEQIDNLQDWTDRVQSPLQQLEHRLHNWVAFFIMPLFAFSNAGVSFGDQSAINSNLAISIAISLLLGKLLGVGLFSFASIKLKLASLPLNVSLQQILGVSLLAGVGFTMSLFIGNLAFTDNAIFLNSAKIGIIAGSVLAGIMGYLVLRFSFKSKI